MPSLPLIVATMLACSSSAPGPTPLGPLHEPSAEDVAARGALSTATAVRKKNVMGQRQPMSSQVALLKVGHPTYIGRELFIDGQRRGSMPVDVVLPHGTHRFEILVGPGNRLAFDRTIEPGIGIRVLDLGAEP